ncbi:Uncharacterized protein OBRU01_22027 [Operophtera brumata]|uniref:Chitin-binding type-2 domain-containing protein n=1 Tax=Operophtera brumata TaxID=104452 RepID=A0A0L7KSC6_OPEBR|nr:Uncharacterized protein OBRU01_22027 [Operophtera brumata]
MASWAGAQNGRGPPSHEHNGHGWDIRLAVPGEPGSDYPTLGNIPRTHFSCAGKEPGYYADAEAGCQVFRVCTVGSTYGFQSFLCPNGTLFNQDVFVCDWWMNVKCRPAERLTATNFDQFGNLRLGPQLMKDIKKMLTHTMRNPYDKNAMKGNLIVMQDYRPPAGQLFPNEALIAGPERVPSNVYVPAKQILQTNLSPSYPFSDNTYAASTPDTNYIPASFTNQVQESDAEVFQRQRVQSAQYVQNGRTQPTPNTDTSNFSNGRARQLIQQNSRLTSSGQQPNHNYNQQVNPQYTQRNNAGNTFTTNTYTNQMGQLNRQRAQYTDVRKPTQFNSGNQNEVVSYAKQQYNEEKQPYTYRQPNPTFSTESDVGKELKQNLVSAPVPATVITKTLTYSKLIQEPKPGRPKSRITVKTWIVKPKSGRLIAEPTPYTYDRPTQTPAERLVQESSAYVYTRPTLSPQSARLVTDEKPNSYIYNRPTATPQIARLMTDDSPKPYVYNRPTIPPPARIIKADEPKPYVYNRPTAAAKLVATTKTEPPPRAYIPPAPTQPTRPQTQAARLVNLPQSPPPTQSSKIIVPTTFKPSSRLYLPPPPENAQIVSRQYLAPLQQAPYYQSSQLRAPQSAPTPAHLSSNRNNNGNNNNNNNLSYTATKQPTKTNRKNLTFSDILTKEKLDLTVSDIVKDTGSILQTASPPQFGQYVKGTKSVNDPNIMYLPAENESGEDLTSEAPSSTTASKSARLIAQPASNLEPPVESFNNNKNTNQLSNLPFYKESAVPNTIERTVSLKITLPERVASYIFRGGNETDYDNLEILNTGSSNYLVLSNTMLNQGGNFITIGKLSENKNSNISNSQALVFSFLADSLNAAKKYSNVAKQDILTSMSTKDLQNEDLNNEELSHIANKLSQLTSSQYSTNNNRSPNTAARIQATTSTSQSNQAKYTNNEQSSTQPTQSAQYNIAPSLQTQEQLYSSPYQTDSNANLLDSNQDVIYSGQLYQLPVPEVTSQIYNRPLTGNLIQTNLQNQKQITSPPQATNQNNNLPNHNNLMKQSSAEVEIVQSKTLPITPAKLQLVPTNEAESFYGQESLQSLLNSDNGISAQLQDKIVGVIPHPLEDSKLVSYEKDQSYYLYTKLDNNAQNTKLTRGNNIPNVITFQFVPSVSYQLEDEKEQQKLLNSFQIDEFGAPWDAVKANLVQESNQQEPTMVSNIDFTVEHPSSRPTSLNSVNALYKGPSSYSAPQGSIVNLPRQTLIPNSLSSRLQQLDIKSNNGGYPKAAPARRFIF